MADLQQLAIQVVHRAINGRWHHRAGGLEGLWRIGIGNTLALLRIGERAERGEFVATSFAYKLRQLAVVAGEKQEGLLDSVFIAHEEQRNHRR